MYYSYYLLIPIFLPILAGIFLIAGKGFQRRRTLLGFVGTVLVVTAICVIYSLLFGKEEITLFWLTKSLRVYFNLDNLGRIFAGVVTLVMVVCGFYAFSYMKQEENEKFFYGFYLCIFGILIGLDFSGNLITMYLFYELVTLFSLPLVLHTLTRESIMAGLKYIFYSFAGAYMALFGLFFLNRYTNTLSFSAGGVLDLSLVAGNEWLILLVAFIMVLGFGVKAGLFPMHAWLPAAHPVAPSPASAILSGIIVKSGVLAIVRVVFYIIGADFLRGTWVQYTWMILALITVFLGSMLAYGEPVMKKRLAYSTISQLSYILFGIFLLNPMALTGSLSHVVFHAIIKSGLFLIAGSVIQQTGRKHADQFGGLGKEMPVAMWCYTLLSLALVGIPPFSGFISKWYLATGALQTEIPVFSWLGPVILLISALLTAGYLLPAALKAFFPVQEEKLIKTGKSELSMGLLIPILVMTIVTVLLGLMPNGLIAYIAHIANQLM